MSFNKLEDFDNLNKLGKTRYKLKENGVIIYYGKNRTMCEDQTGVYIHVSSSTKRYAPHIEYYTVDKYDNLVKQIFYEDGLDIQFSIPAEVYVYINGKEFYLNNSAPDLYYDSDYYLDGKGNLIYYSQDNTGIVVHKLIDSNRKQRLLRENHSAQYVSQILFLDNKVVSNNVPDIHDCVQYIANEIAKVESIIGGELNGYVFKCRTEESNDYELREDITEEEKQECNVYTWTNWDTYDTEMHIGYNEVHAEDLLPEYN